MVKTYKPSSSELKTFEESIVVVYKTAQYIMYKGNEEHFLTNIFKATVVEQNHENKAKKLIDTFALNFLEFYKLIYNGADPIEHKTVQKYDSKLFELDKRMEEARDGVKKKSYYANCDDAWADGVLTIYKWDAAYRLGLDGDKDGVACE
jgi:hypothetical protein